MTIAFQRWPQQLFPWKTPFRNQFIKLHARLTKGKKDSKSWGGVGEVV